MTSKIEEMQEPFLKKPIMYKYLVKENHLNMKIAHYYLTHNIEAAV